MSDLRPLESEDESASTWQIRSSDGAVQGIRPKLDVNYQPSNAPALGGQQHESRGLEPELSGARPKCPTCGETMILVKIVFGIEDDGATPRVIDTWQCYPCAFNSGSLQPVRRSLIQFG